MAAKLLKAYVYQYVYDPKRSIVEIPYRTIPGREGGPLQAWFSLADTMQLLNIVPVQKEEHIGLTVWVFSDGSSLFLDKTGSVDGAYGRFGLKPPATTP